MTRSSETFDFNTVANNDSPNADGWGVDCEDSVSGVSANNNIVTGPSSGDAVSGAGCSWTYSNIQNATLPLGTGNINETPTYLDGEGGDFHLASGSAGIDVADPAATMTIDLDDDARPVGDGYDMGADEFGTLVRGQLSRRRLPDALLHEVAQKSTEMRIRDPRGTLRYAGLDMEGRWQSARLPGSPSETTAFVVPKPASIRSWAESLLLPSAEESSRAERV